MTRANSRALTAVAIAFVAGGAVYFASSTHLAATGNAGAALGVVALVALVYLMRTVDPAWLLAAGVVTTMFAGHWVAMGINVNPAPHRILLGAAAIGLVFRVGKARDRPPIHLTGTHFLLAAASAYAAISAYVSGTLESVYSQSALLDVFGVLPFVMFVLAPVAFRSERQRNIFLGALVGTGVYLSVTALFEKLKLTALVVPNYINNPGVGSHFGRARGPFVEAGMEGLALLICTVAAVIAFRRWQKGWQRAAALVVIVLGPVGILETVTRGVWLGAIVGAFVALATTHGLRRYLLPVGAAGVVAVVAAFALIPGLAGQAQERQNDKSPVYERQNTTAAGLRMVADRPVLGFGWSKGYDRIDPYFRLDPNIPLTGRTAGLHDLYLRYAVELGVVGLGLWLLAAFASLGGALIGRVPESIRPWQIGLKACVVAWVVVSLVSPAEYPFPAFVLWTWAGIVYGRREPALAPMPEPRAAASLEPA